VRENADGRSPPDCAEHSPGESVTAGLKQDRRSVARRSRMQSNSQRKRSTTKPGKGVAKEKRTKRAGTKFVRPSAESRDPSTKRKSFVSSIRFLVDYESTNKGEIRRERESEFFSFFFSLLTMVIENRKK
jgi:hypothetical protein